MQTDFRLYRPSAGEVGSAIIVMQLTLLAMLMLLLITLRPRKQAPPHLVAAFDRAFLPEVGDGR